MKYLFKEWSLLRAIIEQDLKVGYYLHIYNLEGICIADHLQDTLEIAKEQAKDEYQIPLDGWVVEHLCVKLDEAGS